MLGIVALAVALFPIGRTLALMVLIEFITDDLQRVILVDISHMR